MAEPELPSIGVDLDYEEQRVKIYWDYPTAVDIATYRVEILGRDGVWHKEGNECDGENELIAAAKFCEVRV